MDVFEAMIGRRSVRRFTGEPVAAEDLERILEAGRVAPSWANTQCWEVVLVRDPAIKDQLVETIHKSNPGRKAVAAAPLVLAAAGRRGSSGYYKGKVQTAFGDWLMFDVALFLDHVTLAAHALGYGTVHVGMFDHAAAARVLGIPDDLQLLELVPIGRPDPAKIPKMPKRRAVAEFVHHEKYRPNVVT
jgi:nitroreductase